MNSKIKEYSSEHKCKFLVPITACNLMFEFDVVQINKTTVSNARPGYNSYSNHYGK